MKLLGYLILLVLFFLNFYNHVQPSYSWDFTVPICIFLSVGMFLLLKTFWNSPQLRKLALGSSLVVFLVFCFFVFQLPRNSWKFVVYQLTQQGYRDTTKFTSLWTENQTEFERMVSEIVLKVGNQACNPNMISKEQDIRLKQSFGGMPLYLHPNCYKRSIHVSVMNYRHSERSYWDFNYLIDWAKGAKQQKCGERISCILIAPGWLIYRYEE